MGSSRTRLAVALVAANLLACSLSRGVTATGEAGPRPVDASVDAAVEADAAELDTGRPEDVGAPPDAPRDAATPWTVDYGTGTFTRASQASFLSRPPDGTGGFLSWAVVDVRRFEDRGDGAGALLLVEGTRTNLLLRSRDPVAASWALAGSPGLVLVDDALPGPDAMVTAHRLTGSGYSQGQAVPPSTLPHVVSAWGRASTTTTVWTANFSYPDQPSAPAWAVPAQSETWERRSDVVPLITRGTYFPIDLTIGPGVLDIALDLHQIEAGRFASSAIQTADSTVTRVADLLTFASSQVPPQLFSGRGHYAQVSPVFASSALATGDEHWLLGITGANGIRIRHDGGAVVIEAVQDGMVRATSAPLAFGEHALLGPIEWAPAEGRIYVAGASGPVGTPWSWPVGEVRIGGVVGGAGEAFARLGALAGE